MRGPFDARAPALIAVLFLLTPLAEAAFVRANCRGIQEFSATEPRVSCEESSVLSGDNQRVMLGHTRAVSSLAEARLPAEFLRAATVTEPSVGAETHEHHGASAPTGGAVEVIRRLQPTVALASTDKLS